MDAFAVFEGCRPKRSVVVADGTLIVLAHNFWTGKPKAVVATLPAGPFHRSAGRKSVTIPLGSDQVTFPAKEIDHLAEATAAIAPPAAAASAPPQWSGTAPSWSVPEPAAPSWHDAGHR